MPARSRGRKASNRGNRNRDNSDKPTPETSNSDARFNRLKAQMQKILEVLKKGETARAQSVTQTKNKPVPNTKDRAEAEKSDNQEVSELLKNIFQYIGLTHHFENWAEIPDRVDNLVITYGTLMTNTSKSFCFYCFSFSYLVLLCSAM